MEEFKSIIDDFTFYYDSPKVTVRYLDQIVGDDNYLSEELNIFYNEVEVTVNEYSNPVQYYSKLLLIKNKIIDKIWELRKKQSKRNLESVLIYILAILKERQTYFETKQITGSFTYVPVDSPKKLNQKEEIYCKKEELKYLDDEKNLFPSRGTNERRQISVYYYFMVEILNELILFLKNINISHREKKIVNSFQIKLNQSLTDFKNALVARGFIEEIDLKSFNKVFHNEIVEKKINWMRGKEAFRYFILALIDSNCVIPLREKWKIAEKCFLIKGEDIDGDNVSTQQKANELVRESIDNILRNLQKQTTQKSNI